MKQYPTIHLAQGATSAVELDLSEFDFGEGGVVALVVKDRMDNEFASWQFDTPQKHQILFTADMTSMMELGPFYDASISEVAGFYYSDMSVEYPLPFQSIYSVHTETEGNAFVESKVTTVYGNAVAIRLSQYGTDNNMPYTKVLVSVKGFWKDSPESGGTETIAPTIEARFEALENEAVIASGTSDGWEWIKFASGFAILFLRATPPNVNGYVAQGLYSYPFPMLDVYGAYATLNDINGNAFSAMEANAKVGIGSERIVISLHSPYEDTYANWSPEASALVIGRWK